MIELSALLLALVPQDDASATPPPADPAIEASVLSRHVYYLASDEMKGRMTAAPETRRAAEYIATALQQAGVAPAGDDDTYFQSVPLVETHFDASPTLVVERPDGTTWSAEDGTHFRLRVRGKPDASRRLAVAIASDGEAPEGLGDLALFVPGRRGDVAAWFGARELGDGESVGLVLLEGSRRATRPRAMRGSLGIDRGADDPSDQLFLNGELLEALESGEVAALTLDTNAEVEQKTCQNVVGILRGEAPATHPSAADEAIVVTAHYDHIGHYEPEEEGQDTIQNGADDDASGVAAVLELAEALAVEGPPARTIVFLLVTGEERGLLGTEVYLDDPVIPLASTLYNLNLEMIGRPDPLMPGPGELWLTGWNETTLGPSLAGDGQPVQEDPRPEQNFYMRSDNIAFVRRGVMGQTLSSFGMHTDYHRATDEPDTLDYEHMEIATKNVLRVLRALAFDLLPVDWAKKDGEDR